MADRETLEQKRAKDTWTVAGRAFNHLGPDQFKLFVSDAKGMPALIMNSGLMSVFAFIHQKGKKDRRYEILEEELIRWLIHRFEDKVDSFQNIDQHHFALFMQALLQCSSAEYQQITIEAFAWLRWLKQMAAAY